MTLAPTPSDRPRPRYRPPIGIPTPRQNSTGSALASIFFHALIIFLLIGPAIMHEVIVSEREGAGGPGARGGGGGGNRGAAQAEKLNYIEVAPPPPPPPVKQAPTTQPQLVPPPVVKPPEQKMPELPKVDAVPVQASQPTLSAGTGGTGNDGGRGSGPGTGGGVGSGDGTGRGSANGPGTGGGAGRIYPPYVTNLAMLPVPVPNRVKPYTLRAIFEVDENGNAKLITFNETKDSDYNKKVRAMLQEIRFRPATRQDGTPVRDTATVIAEAKL